MIVTGSCHLRIESGGNITACTRAPVFCACFASAHKKKQITPPLPNSCTTPKKHFSVKGIKKKKQRGKESPSKDVFL